MAVTLDEAMNRPGGALGYDLAITDLSMPELDGRSAIVRIRDQEADQSARPTTHNRADCRRPGLDA
jgi:CheY-like chemotaxis protein